MEKTDAKEQSSFPTVPSPASESIRVTIQNKPTTDIDRIKQKLENFLFNAEAQQKYIRSSADKLPTLQQSTKNRSQKRAIFAQSTLKPRTDSLPALSNQRYKRFNEIETKVISRFVPPAEPFQTNTSLGIGLDNTTLASPGMVRDKADFYRREFFSDGTWKQKVQPEKVDNNSPENFPIRVPMNYLRLRAMEKALLEQAKTKIQRPCKEMEHEKLEELEKKRREVSLKREEAFRKRLEIKRRLREKLHEIHMASRHDFNAKKSRMADASVSCSEPIHPKVIKPIVKAPIPVRLFTPYLVSVIFDDYDFVEPDLSKVGKPILPKPRNSMQTVFIRLVSDTEEVQQVNLQRFIRDIKEVDEALPQKSNSEHIVLLPKAFGFGDSTPRDINVAEYSENFKFYRLDPKNLTMYLEKNGISANEDISVEKLKDVLEMAALPLETEEELAKYKEMLEKDKQRKERIETNKLVMEEMRKAKNEEREKRKSAKLQELDQINSENWEKANRKQREIEEKLRQMNELREGERKKKILEKAEQMKQVLTRGEKKGELEGIERVIRKEILRKIVNAAVDKCVKDETVAADTSMTYITKESRYVLQKLPMKILSRKVSQQIVQTSFVLQPEETGIHVDVGYEAMIPIKDSTRMDDNEGTTFEQEKSTINDLSKTGVTDDSRVKEKVTAIKVKANDKEAVLPNKPSSKPGGKLGETAATKNKRSEKEFEQKLATKQPLQKDKKKLVNYAKDINKEKESQRNIPDLKITESDSVVSPDTANAAPIREEHKKTSNISPAKTKHKVHKKDKVKDEPVVEKPASNVETSVAYKNEDQSVIGQYTAVMDEKTVLQNEEKVENEDDANQNVTISKKKKKKDSQKTQKATTKKKPKQIETTTKKKTGKKKKKAKDQDIEPVPDEATNEAEPEAHHPVSTVQEKAKAESTPKRKAPSKKQSDSPRASALPLAKEKEEQKAVPKDPTPEAKSELPKKGSPEKLKSVVSPQSLSVPAAAQIHMLRSGHRKKRFHGEKRLFEQGDHVEFKVQYEEEEIPQEPVVKAPEEKNEPVVEANPNSQKMSIEDLKRNLKALQTVNKLHQKVSSKKEDKKTTDQTKIPIGGTFNRHLTGRKSGTEEEDRLVELYKKLLEEKEKKEAEKKKDEVLQIELKVEEKKEEKAALEDSSGEDDEEEILAILSGKDARMTIEELRRKLSNPKRLARLLNRLQKDENLRNILLQRTQHDIEALEACEAVMDNFFDQEKFPDFNKANLLVSRFTPLVDIEKDLQADCCDNEEDEEDMEKAKTTDLANNNADEYRRLLREKIGEIIAQHIGFKFANSEEQMKKMLDKTAANYEELVNNPDIKNLVPHDKVKALKYHLLILEQIISGRQNVVKELNEVDKARHLRGKSLSERKAANTPERDFLPSIRAKPEFSTLEPGSARKYKVNVELIKKRGKMSQFELMERRYQFLADKDCSKMLKTCVTPRPKY